MGREWRPGEMGREWRRRRRRRTRSERRRRRRRRRLAGIWCRPAGPSRAPVSATPRRSSRAAAGSSLEVRSRLYLCDLSAISRLARFWRLARARLLTLDNAPRRWLCETRPDWTPVAGWVLPRSRFLNDVHRLALPALRWEGVATTGAVPRPRCQAAAAVSADGVCVLESAAAGCLARAHTGCWGVGACLLVYGGAAHAAGPHEHLCYGAAPTALVTRQSRSAKRCVCESRRPRRRPLRHASTPFAHWYVAATRRKRPHLAAAAGRDQRCCLGSPRSERRRRGRRRGAGLAAALWRHELRAGGPHSRLCGGGVAGGGVCVTTV